MTETRASGEQTPAARYRAAEQAMWAAHGAPLPDERWVDVQEPRIRVRVLEAGSGRSALFVHGGPNAGGTWGPLVGELSDIHAVAVDRPGCGLSDPLDYSTMSSQAIAEAMVSTLIASIESTVAAPVDVVGSSFGGACALWLASSRPDLVRSIVLEGVPMIEGARLAMNLRVLAVGPVGRFIAGRTASEDDVRRTFKQLGHGRLVAAGWPSGADRDWGLSMMNDTDTMRNEVALIQHAASWRGFKTGALFDPDGLSGIDAPTLWLIGDRDPFGSPDVCRGWAERMSSASVEIMRDSGHLPWLDDPSMHARKIETFWNSASSIE